MSKHIFTPEEQLLLRGNPHIATCGEKAVTFTEAFKRHAVRAYREDYKSPRSIFHDAGIPLNVLDRELPRACLRRWLAKNEVSLGIDGRGKHGKTGRKVLERSDVEKMTLKEQNDYLKLRIAYTDAENDFLAKLRGIKRVPFVYRPGGDTN